MEKIILNLITIAVPIVFIITCIIFLAKDPYNQSLLEKYILKYNEKKNKDKLKVKILKNGLNNYGVKITSFPEPDYTPVHSSLCWYLIQNRDIQTIFLTNTILREIHAYTPNIYIPLEDPLENLFAFDSLETAKLAVSCLYDSIDQLKKLRSETIIINDCQEDYNNFKKEKHIENIKKELDQYNSEKSKKQNNDT